MKRFFVVFLTVSLLCSLGVLSVAAESAQEPSAVAGASDAVLLVFVSLCFVILTVLVCFYRYRKKHYDRTSGE